MVNGPPCSTCGTPLRWFPDHTAWGCERCQKMIPATPYTPAAAPQPAYQPTPVVIAPPVAQVPAPKRSRRGLLIAVALLVLGGGVAGFLVMRGSSAGLGSRDALVDATLAALNAGDGPALFALGVDEAREGDFMACPEAKRAKDAEELERHQRKARVQAERVVAQTKGKGLVLDAVSEPDADPARTINIKQGEKIEGCTAKVEFASHVLEVKAHDGAGKPATVKLVAMQIDGRWYLVKDPKVGGAMDCAGAVAAMLAKLSPAEARELGPTFGEVLQARCERDAWQDDVVACFAETADLASSDRCMKLMPHDQEKALMDDIAKAASAAAKRPPPAPLPSPLGDIPPACAAYQKVMEKLATCDKLPAASRDALKQSFEAMQRTWAQLANMPPDTLKTINDACQQGVDAMAQMSAFGC